jgi:hypothetical protein
MHRSSYSRTTVYTGRCCGELMHWTRLLLSERAVSWCAANFWLLDYSGVGQTLPISSRLLWVPRWIVFPVDKGTGCYREHSFLVSNIFLWCDGRTQLKYRRLGVFFAVYLGAPLPTGYSDDGSSWFPLLAKWTCCDGACSNLVTAFVQCVYGFHSSLYNSWSWNGLLTYHDAAKLNCPTI